MQNYLDGRLEELKLISNFDIEKEEALKSMSVYEFYFHLLIRSNHADHGKENS